MDVNEEKHITVGKHSSDLLKNPDKKQGIIDTRKEMEKKYIPELEKCIQNHRHWIIPYYVVVILKRERLMINVIRQYFTARQSLPTSDYDQTVYKYFPSSGDLKYLWTVPDRNTVFEMLTKETVIPEEQKQLLRFCKLFVDKKLEIVCGE